MAISPQSIRKNITITFDGVIVSKEYILEVSKSWDEKQEILFKKMIKQGGKFRINGVVISTVPPETILTSRGEKDGGTQKTDPLARF
jgi:hypothetical protein